MGSQTVASNIGDILSLFENDFQTLLPVTYLSDIETFFSGIQVSTLTPITLSSSKIDLEDGQGREVIIQGSGFSLKLNLGDLQTEFKDFVTAIGALSAKGTFSSLTLKQNGVTIAGLTLTSSSLTLVSGADTLKLVGSFPTSLSQVDTALKQLYNTTTHKLNTNFNAATSALAGYDLKSVTASVNGVVQASLVITKTGIDFSSSGYSFDITGVLPTNFAQLVKIGIEIQKSAGHAVTTGYSISTASIIDSSTGAVLGSINFNKLDFGDIVGQTLPATVKISFTDSASDLATHLDQLESAAAHISAITLSDSTVPLLISQAQFANDQGILGKIVGPFILEVPIGNNEVDVYNYTSAGPGAPTTVLLPTIDGTVAGQTTELEGQLNPFSQVVVSDPNQGATDTVKITLSGSGGAFLAEAGLTDEGGGVYELAAADANTITNELEALVFVPNAAWPASLGTTTFTLSVTSKGALVSAINATTTVIDNEPFGAITLSAAYLEANIDGIAADSKVTSIELTDGDTLTLTAKQFNADLAAVAKIKGGLNLVIEDTGAGLDLLTPAAIAKLPQFGVTELVETSGALNFSAKQTAALEKAELFLTATGAATARELFANGGYDNFVFANDGSLTSETLYSSAHAHAILAADTSSGLSLSASKLTVSETTAGLSVSSGADVSWISPLNSSSTESVAAQAGATNETFAFGTGFGSDSITGFIAGSGKTHDILELSYKDLGITKQTSKTWIADLQTVGGNVTITEHIGGGSITLVGVSASSLVAADFKFTA